MMVISSLVPYIYVQLLQVFIPLIYDTKVQIQSCIVTRLLVFIHECLSAYRDIQVILNDRRHVAMKVLENVLVGLIRA